ncbi:unnamed protein product, partial [Onchocerca ochengi]|uniref:Cytospin-A n=1 Tax=Onchocerca ochengi TaxID=42157 RepID=A0A182EWD6_ONCOC
GSTGSRTSGLPLQSSSSSSSCSNATTALQGGIKRSTTNRTPQSSAATPQQIQPANNLDPAKNKRTIINGTYGTYRTL